jgi:hypothetical protein
MASRCGHVAATVAIHVLEIGPSYLGADDHRCKGPVQPMTFARLSLAAIGLVTLAMASGVSAGDPGKKACATEARALCPAEMRTFSRKKVEACMIARIDQTSPICHAAMLQIKAQRGA